MRLKIKPGKVFGLAVVVAIVMISIVLSNYFSINGYKNDNDNDLSDPVDVTGTSEVPTRSVTRANIDNDISPRSYTIVRLETNYGIIDMELYDDEAPITVENFLKYVNDGFYDGLIFHRVIQDFVIQGGGFYQDMTEKTATYPLIENEAKLSNLRGTVAMARTNDPDSATCQFYINVVDNTYLDSDEPSSGSGYCVFGKVTNGMVVVDDISVVSTHTENGYEDVPVNDVIIEDAYVYEDKNNNNNPPVTTTKTDSDSETDSLMMYLVIGSLLVIGVIVISVLVVLYMGRTRRVQKYGSMGQPGSYPAGNERPVHHGAYGASSQPPSQPPPPPTSTLPTTQFCTNCGSRLQYLRQYQRWYCEKCGKYE